MSVSHPSSPLLLYSLTLTSGKIIAIYHVRCCAVVFLSIYTYHCSNKGYVVRTLAAFLSVLTMITVYAVVGGLGYTGQSISSVGTMVGILADCAGICLYGAPLEKLFQVLKHKSAVFINVHMVIAGLVNNSIWLVYGILISNWFIIFINILFVSVNTFTLCLYHPAADVCWGTTHPLQDAWHTHDVDQGEISVCIVVTPRLEAKKSLTSMPSPDCSYVASPTLENLRH
ncbi:unnamed protein product [Phytophthora fragariaefolia]|uniref:Unnamed protein product n=1 Tax=Phytophthora fragariaefolia TaxID=1490495 RepID=A0A9W7DCC0_9STRA|nr:unnamed protein product [Phytophthora fragariaefolia]